MQLLQLNQLPAQQALTAFLDCCASHRWAAAMTQARPFADLQSLARQAEFHWRLLDDADRLAREGLPRRRPVARAASAAAYCRRA